MGKRSTHGVVKGSYECVCMWCMCGEVRGQVTMWVSEMELRSSVLVAGSVTFQTVLSAREVFVVGEVRVVPYWVQECQGKQLV